MHIAFNGWFWDQPYTGSGQYLRRSCWMRCTGWRRTPVIARHPGADAQLDGLPPLVDVLPVGGRFGGDPGQSVVRAARDSRARWRACKPISPTCPTGRRACAGRFRSSATVLSVIPLALPEYRAGLSTACIPAL